MTRLYLSFLLLLIAIHSPAQLSIIGHAKLNNESLRHTLILVETSGVVTKTVNTGASSDFLFQVDLGKNYLVKFINPRSPVLVLEIIGNTIPADKYIYKMTHELDVQFFDRRDEDIDTAVFKNPFNRIVFDGKSKMVSDTVYNNAFAKKILRQDPPESRLGDPLSAQKAVMLAGQIILNNNPKLTVNNKGIELIGKKGEILGATYTNRYGAFTFSRVKLPEIAAIRMALREVTAASSIFTIVNSKSYTVTASKPQNGICTWSCIPKMRSPLPTTITPLMWAGSWFTPQRFKKEFSPTNRFTSATNTTPFLNTPKPVRLAPLCLKTLNPITAILLGWIKKS